MGVRFYDDALLEKLKKWTVGTNTFLTGVNETKRMFETTLDKNNDRPIKLPLIALSRPGGYTILNRNQRPLAHDGNALIRPMIKNLDGDLEILPTRGARVSAIPIGINYQLDIYTRYIDEADEYARNFIFNIINYPKLNIEIPYEDLKVLTHDANIRLTSDVEDNSDIPERLIPGQFTRLTLGINIDDAYLFDVRIKDNLSIKEISVIPDKDPAELITVIN